MTDGFVTVTKGHRLCAKKRKDRGGHSTRDCTPIDERASVSLAGEDVICRRIRQRKEELEIANFLKVINCNELVEAEEVVCYGIGKVGESLTAQYQVAAILLLKETLLLKVRNMFIYDPVLQDNELAVLKRLGFTDIGFNEHCRREAHVVTLFFMPHCGLSLYNNLLYANWSPETLSNCIIIGNSFSNYFMRLTDSELKIKAHFLREIKDVFSEIAFPSVAASHDVFNDTSIHLLQKSALMNLSQNVWTQYPIPLLDPEDEEMTL